MDAQKILHAIKPPCPKCPYTLGLVKFVTSPCPSCKMDNYQTYHLLAEGRYKNHKGDILKD
jgi:predicted Zn-ribbon and HTH transcriptional regulator